MKKIHLAIILLLIITGFKASAQSYEVPKNYVLKAKEDYPKYEDDIIKTVDWLQQTSWAEQADKRKEANTFLIAWITGSPNVSITLGSPLLKFTDKNKELLITFMAGYTKYALQHKSDMTVDKANAAALRALMDKYNSDPARKKDSAIEKLIKTDKDGKLDEWIKANFYKS
ncbi:MAG TPA: hypothetical protein VK668_23645 [Mucilaginibacter sp.]|nr:hypothetical protein [Mucilaginibacter sp.]